MGVGSLRSGERRKPRERKERSEPPGGQEGRRDPTKDTPTTEQVYDVVDDVGLEETQTCIETDSRERPVLGRPPPIIRKNQNGWYGRGGAVVGHGWGNTGECPIDPTSSDSNQGRRPSTPVGTALRRKPT